MERWQSAVEKAIQQALDEGQLTNLPGEGQPLNLNDNPHTPDDLKMAYKLLKDNDLAPDWMQMGRELEDRQGQMRQRLRRAVETYEAAQTDALKRAQAEAAWRQAQTKLAADAERYNREVTTYNLKTPPGIAKRPYFDLSAEIRRARQA